MPQSAPTPDPERLYPWTEEHDLLALYCGELNDRPKFITDLHVLFSQLSEHTGQCSMEERIGMSIWPEAEANITAFCDTRPFLPKGAADYLFSSWQLTSPEQWRLAPVGSYRSAIEPDIGPSVVVGYGYGTGGRSVRLTEHIPVIRLPKPPVIDYNELNFNRAVLHRILAAYWKEAKQQAIKQAAIYEQAREAAGWPIRRAPRAQQRDLKQRARRLAQWAMDGKTWGKIAGDEKRKTRGNISQQVRRDAELLGVRQQEQ